MQLSTINLNKASANVILYAANLQKKPYTFSSRIWGDMEKSSDFTAIYISLHS